MSDSDGVALGAGKEFDAIRRLIARWGARAAGIGDDAAVLALPPDEKLVVSVDATVEGRHFRREWLEPREVGWRATTAALSDLAAMAARPIGILVALALPAVWLDALDDLADGIGDAAAAAGAPIVGGNTTAAGELSITTTVVGAARAPLGRGGVRAGDRLYVTGTLGGPWGAIDAWLHGRAPSPAHRARFAHPVARIAEARWLAERGATAAVDVSDGLVADAGHLAAASGVALELALERIPRLDGATPLDAAASGEEYELLVAAPAPLDAAGFERRFGAPLTEIGRAVAGPPEVRCTLDGARVAPPRGHDHLSR